MSIEYNANLAFDYKLTDDEVSPINKAYSNVEDWETFDNLCDNFIINLLMQKKSNLIEILA